MRTTTLITAILAALFAGTAWAVQPTGEGGGENADVGKNRPLFMEYHQRLREISSATFHSEPSPGIAATDMDGGWAFRGPRKDKREQCFLFDGEEKYCSSRWLARHWSRDNFAVAWGAPESLETPTSFVVFLPRKHRLQDAPARVEFPGQSVVAASKARDVLAVAFNSQSGTELKVFRFDGTLKFSQTVPGEYMTGWEAQNLSILDRDGSVLLNTGMSRAGSGSFRIYDEAGALKFSYPIKYGRHFADRTGRLVVLLGNSQLAVYSHEVREIVFSRELIPPIADGRLMQLEFAGFTPDSTQFAVSWVQAENPGRNHKRMIRKIDAVDMVQGRIDSATGEIEIANGEAAEMVAPKTITLKGSGRQRTYEIIP